MGRKKQVWITNKAAQDSWKRFLEAQPEPGATTSTAATSSTSTTTATTGEVLGEGGLNENEVYYRFHTMKELRGQLRKTPMIHQNLQRLPPGLVQEDVDDEPALSQIGGEQELGGAGGGAAALSEQYHGALTTDLALANNFVLDHEDPSAAEFAGGGGACGDEVDDGPTVRQWSSGAGAGGVGVHQAPAPAAPYFISTSPQHECEGAEACIFPPPQLQQQLHAQQEASGAHLGLYPVGDHVYLADQPYGYFMPMPHLDLHGSSPSRPSPSNANGKNLVNHGDRCTALARQHKTHHLPHQGKELLEAHLRKFHDQRQHQTQLDEHRTSGFLQWNNYNNELQAVTETVYSDHYVDHQMNYYKKECRPLPAPRSNVLPYIISKGPPCSATTTTTSEANRITFLTTDYITTSNCAVSCSARDTTTTKTTASKPAPSICGAALETFAEHHSPAAMRKTTDTTGAALRAGASQSDSPAAQTLVALMSPTGMPLDICFLEKKREEISCTKMGGRTRRRRSSSSRAGAGEDEDEQERRQRGEEQEIENYDDETRAPPASSSERPVHLDVSMEAVPGAGHWVTASQNPTLEVGNILLEVDGSSGDPAAYGGGFGGEGASLVVPITRTKVDARWNHDQALDDWDCAVEEMNDILDDNLIRISDEAAAHYLLTHLQIRDRQSRAGSGSSSTLGDPHPPPDPPHLIGGRGANVTASSSSRRTCFTFRAKVALERHILLSSSSNSDEDLLLGQHSNRPVAALARCVRPCADGLVVDVSPEDEEQHLPAGEEESDAEDLGQSALLMLGGKRSTSGELGAGGEKFQKTSPGAQRRRMLKRKKQTEELRRKKQTELRSRSRSSPPRATYLYLKHLKRGDVVTGLRKRYRSPEKRSTATTATRSTTTTASRVPSPPPSSSSSSTSSRSSASASATTRAQLLNLCSPESRSGEPDLVRLRQEHIYDDPLALLEIYAKPDETMLVVDPLEGWELRFGLEVDAGPELQDLHHDPHDRPLQRPPKITASKVDEVVCSLHARLNLQMNSSTTGPKVELYVQTTDEHGVETSTDDALITGIGVQVFARRTNLHFIVRELVNDIENLARCRSPAPHWTGYRTPFSPAARQKADYRFRPTSVARMEEVFLFHRHSQHLFTSDLDLLCPEWGHQRDKQHVGHRHPIRHKDQTGS